MRNGLVILIAASVIHIALAINIFAYSGPNRTFYEGEAKGIMSDGYRTKLDACSAAKEMAHFKAKEACAYYSHGFAEYWKGECNCESTSKKPVTWDCRVDWKIICLGTAQ